MPSASGSDSSETGMASERTRAKRAPSGLPSTPSPARSAPIGVSPVGRPVRRSSWSCKLRTRGCPRDRGKPERGSLERMRQRRRVEAGAAEHVVARDDERVVRGRVELELDGGAQPLEGRPRAAVHYRGAAERQGILQQARPAGLEQRTALERRADLRRRPGMTRERARRNDAGVGRRGVPLEPLERQGDRGVRDVEQTQRVRGRERGRADRERVRRAERERVSWRELGQRDAGALERPAPLQDARPRVRRGRARRAAGRGVRGLRDRPALRSRSWGRPGGRRAAAWRRECRRRRGRRPTLLRRSRRPVRRGPREPAPWERTGRRLPRVRRGCAARARGRQARARVRDSGRDRSSRRRCACRRPTRARAPRGPRACGRARSGRA